MKTITALLTTVVLTLALGGCGGSDDNSRAPMDDAGGDVQPRLYNESEIVEHLGLVDDGTDTNSYTYTSPSGAECGIAVVLTSSQAVEMYANAGDDVASNSIGSAGVKFGGAELATCQEALTEALADLS